MTIRVLKKVFRQIQQKVYLSGIRRQTKKIICSLKQCGEDLTVYGNPILFSPGKLVIGRNCKINEGVYINARSGVHIGDNVTISPFAKIISTGYDIEKWMKSGERCHFNDKPIVIGNNCWIGAAAIILPGVKITGNYVVIGAGTVVAKNISEDRVLVVGNPGRIIKRYNVTDDR